MMRSQYFAIGLLLLLLPVLGLASSLLSAPIFREALGVMFASQVPPSVSLLLVALVVWLPLSASVKIAMVRGRPTRWLATVSSGVFLFAFVCLHRVANDASGLTQSTVPEDTAELPQTVLDRIGPLVQLLQWTVLSFGGMWLAWGLVDLHLGIDPLFNQITGRVQRYLDGRFGRRDGDD